jgi:hypothetical protein
MNKSFLLRIDKARPTDKTYMSVGVMEDYLITLFIIIR